MEKKQSCNISAKLLMTYLHHPEQYKYITEHLTTCTEYQKALEKLAQAALIEGEDILTCQQCEIDMPDYITTQLTKECLPKRFSIVTRHLETCPYCYQRYKSLLEINSTFLSGPLPTLTQIPMPDLSFLAQQTTEVPLTMLEQFLTLKEVIMAQMVPHQKRPQTLPVRQGIHSRITKGIRYMYYAEKLAVDVHITLRYKPVRSTSVTLKGQLIPLKQPLSYLAGKSVTLFKEAKKITHSQINTSGDFSFSDLETGTYDIGIEWNTSQTLLIKIQIENHDSVRGR